MTNANANQVLDNASEVAAPVVAKKPSLFKKLAQFQTPDGRVFETQREASEHVRQYLVVEAIGKVAAGFTGSVIVTDADGDEQVVEQSLADYLLANKEAVLKAYDAAKVERAPVSEETKAKMKAARAAGRSLAKDPIEPAPEATAAE